MARFYRTVSLALLLALAVPPLAGPPLAVPPLAVSPLAAADNELRVLTGPLPETAGGTPLATPAEGPLEIPPGKQLERLLQNQLHAALDARGQAYEQLKSKADCRQWQRERREFFLQQLGGLPPRTPLNARVVGRLEGDGYRVENILFASRPGHHVTANLYLPNSQPPYPAVLVPCGHSHNGKAAGGYQRMCILLARHGMAALCYDPIGQGERYQMLDFERDHTHFESVSYPLPVPHPRVRFLCTTEHTTMGLGCILLGTNIAQYRIWDGMRAIDYLQSRDDIRPDRIGCTGNSGGGTLTAYLMALDERIVAAAPVCYLTTFRRLIASRGAQDAEQNLFAQLAFGLDQPDYVMMRAPTPILICAGTRDATFDIEGTWDLYRQSKRFYSRLGYPHHVSLHETDAPHGFSIHQREAAARWMHRWLLGAEKDIREVDPESLPDPIDDQQLRELSQPDWTQEQLYCTPRGQVLLMPDEKSVFQLNAEWAQSLVPQRQQRWAQLTPDSRRALVRQVIGDFRPNPSAAAESRQTVSNDATGKDPAGQANPEPRVRSWGQVARAGLTIHKLSLEVEPGLVLPALVLVPPEPTNEVCLYLHGESIQADAGEDGPIERLARQGYIVLAAELRGIGETETGHDKQDYGRGRFGRDVQEIFLAYLLGRSYVGMRTEDVAAWTRYAHNFNAPKGRPNRVRLIALGEAAIPALHAAALAPDHYQAVQLTRMLPSWMELVRAPESLNQAANVVHGALRHYDLPDLIELAGRDKVTLDTPVDAVGRPRGVAGN